MRILMLFLAFVALFSVEVKKSYEPVEGDFLIQSFADTELTRAIESCTKSNYSHCGIVEKLADRWYVIEAVGPVKETSLDQWIKQGREGKIAAFRLADVYRAKIPELIQAAKAYMGRPYDIHMDMDDSKIYCSELLFKAFRDVYKIELAKTQTLGELNWRPNEAFIRKIENGKLPLDRVMVTPLAIAESENVVKVYSEY